MSDGSGNAIILYSENSWEVSKLQKLNSEGKFLWHEGVDIYSLGRQMISDNLGGAIISGVRREFDGVSVQHIVGANRINLDGQLLWGEKGIQLVDSLVYEPQKPKMALDKKHQLYCVWSDKRTGTLDTYLQHVDLEGKCLFKEGGLPVSLVDSEKGNAFVYSSDREKAIVVFGDTRQPDRGLYAQKIDSLGRRCWSNGVLISSRIPSSLDVISDFTGGAILCWYEIGTGSGWGIFAQQVSRYGNLGEVVRTSIGKKPARPTQFVLYQSYPNPFNSETIIKYELPKVTHVTLKIYDINGKEVMILINKKQQAGIHQVIWNGKNHKGGDVSSGIYLYQLFAGSFVDNKKGIYVK